MASSILSRYAGARASMPQVAEQPPAGGVLSGYAQQPSGPLMQASALQIPQNIPADAAQQANIASGMGGSRPDHSSDFNRALADFQSLMQAR